ncbi:hypothetical protein [Nonlabens agnitus]|uniref:DUF4625 domain-containing protein n=1 Tax=Nonlabens agnitus TaxID=870484 RepID=A0A2S9WW57_9FLAO|nr:hypothetical protein [Nonlabens agnitus]PRP67684.1 hypothetical protein BST86_11575 [Nonlabens agnitus]
MKFKFIALLAFIALGISSCELSDDNQPQIQLVALGITDVEIPDPFLFGQDNDIVIRYNNPSSCHRFEGFQIQNNLNIYEVTVFANVLVDGASCEDNNLSTEQVLSFPGNTNGTLVFKFFTGLDAAGNQEFLEIEVDVVE